MYKKPIIPIKLLALVMTILAIIVAQLLNENIYAADDLRKTIITDPSISRRCDALMKQRNLKVKHKQKIMDLIQRNKQLISITPPERKSVIEKLRKNFKGLSHELRHTLNQIQHREESIIRKGCPGITL